MKYFNLSTNQYDVWFDQKNLVNVPFYVIGWYMSLNILTEKNILINTIKNLIKFNDGLRVRYAANCDKILQYFSHNYDFEPNYIDFSKNNDPETDAQNYISIEMNTPFKIFEEIPYRISIIKLKDDHYYIHYCFYHLVIDGMAFYIMQKQFEDIFYTLSENKTYIPQRVYSFKNILFKDSEYKISQKFEEDKNYWESKFSNPPENLFSILPDKSIDDFTTTNRMIEVPNNIFNKLSILADEYKISVQHILLSILYCILINYRNNDIVILLPLHNRDDSDTQKVIGYLSSSLFLLIKQYDSILFKELAVDIRNTLSIDYTHKNYPTSLISEYIVEHLGRDDIFQVLFSYDDFNKFETKYDTNFTFHKLENDYMNNVIDIYVSNLKFYNNVIIDLKFRNSYCNAEFIDNFSNSFNNFISNISEFMEQPI